MSKLRVNRNIRVPQVLLIDQDGVKIGVIDTETALQKAKQAGLDLVEVVPTERPPVCKIINYGRFRYEQTRREKESKKGRSRTKLKEIKFKLNIGKHDLEIKCNRAREFLEKGNKVKVTCMFRGRENAKPEFGFNLVRKVAEDLSDVGVVEMEMKKMGRMLTMMIAPTGKKSAVKKKEETQNAKNEN